jgi:DNA-binding MarR family transcriptional regulator
MADLRQLFSDIIRFETELWNAVDARLRDEFDLPLARFEFMMFIANHPACRVHDIATAMAITVGGTSKLVDRIEAAGHCRRRPNPDDRRSSIIELTAAGKRLLAKASRVFDEELERLLGGAVSERSLQQFAATLAMLRAARQGDAAAARVA